MAIHSGIASAGRRNSLTDQRRSSLTGGNNRRFEDAVASPASGRIHRSITKKQSSFREKFFPGAVTMKNVFDKESSNRQPTAEAASTETVSSPVDEQKRNIARLWENYHLIHPSSAQKMKWDGVLAITILYSVIITPYRIGFDDPATGFAEILDICIDIFFGFDMIVNFNTCYLDSEDESLITSRCRIAQNYLRTWFVIDFASTFPIDRIVESFVGGGGNLRSLKMIRFLRLIRLLKLLRLLKLSKFAKGDGLEQNMSINPSLIKLFKLLFAMVFLAHLIACFFYFIAYDPETDPFNSKYIPGKVVEVSWITKYATNYDHGVDIHDKGQQYVIVVQTVVTMYTSYTHTPYTHTPQVRDRAVLDGGHDDGSRLRRCDGDQRRREDVLSHGSGDGSWHLRLRDW
jgi:hypothetical protein